MRGPLERITVSDLTLAVVGPWSTMLLGGLGANVIKVEIPSGDIMLRTPPKQRRHGVFEVEYVGVGVVARGTTHPALFVAGNKED